MRRSFRSRSRDESGFTLMELSVALGVGLVVFLGLFTLIGTTTRSSARVTERVAVDQLARPAMQRVIDVLHSTCVSPGIAPVLPGSGDSSISLIHQTGSEPSPVPDRRVIAVSGGTLTDSTYANTGGTAPDWTFAATPTEVYTVLEDVSQASLGNPPVVEPIFRYYAYSAGAISATPLPTPLSAANARITVQVTVAFEASPGANAEAIDANAAVTLVDTALLRFSPSNEDTNKAGLPCT